MYQTLLKVAVSESPQQVLFSLASVLQSLAEAERGRLRFSSLPVHPSSEAVLDSLISYLHCHHLQDTVDETQLIVQELARIAVLPEVHLLHHSFPVPNHLSFVWQKSRHHFF